MATKKAKKIKPTLTPDQIVQAADRFYASLFLGKGNYDKRECATLDEAIAALDSLKADHPKSTRRPMLYAMIDGRSEFIDYTALAKPGAEETTSGEMSAESRAELAGELRAQAKSRKRGVAARMERVNELLAKPRPEKKPREARAQSGKRAEVIAAAQAGTLPAPPDFSAATHARFRTKLRSLIDMVAAGDVAGLKAAQINPVSSSPKAMARYRDLCVIALEAKAAA